PSARPPPRPTSATPCSNSAPATAHSWSHWHTSTAWSTRRTRQAAIYRVRSRSLAFLYSDRGMRKDFLSTTTAALCAPTVSSNGRMETMRQMVVQLYRGLAWLTMAGFVVQFYLIGVALFGVTTVEMHRRFGYLLAIPVVLILILALAGRLGGRPIALSTLLLVLFIVQAVLPSLRGSVPWLAALHPLNALALMGVAAALGRAAVTEPPGSERPVQIKAPA